MYQSGFGSGAGFLVSFGLAQPLPETGSLWWFARLVLDAAGSLFACYLACCLAMTVAAVTVRILTASGRRAGPRGYL
jgi:hypothetical protein